MAEESRIKRPRLDSTMFTSFGKEDLAAYKNMGEIDLKGFSAPTEGDLFLPKSFNFSDYQIEVIKSIILHDSLINLSRSDGKMLVPATIMYNYQRWFPDKKVIFVSPAHYNLMSIMEMCTNYLRIPEHDLLYIKSESDIKDMKQKKIIFIKTEVFKEMLAVNRFDVKEFRCVLFDNVNAPKQMNLYKEVANLLNNHRFYFKLMVMITHKNMPNCRVQEILKTFGLSKYTSDLMIEGDYREMNVENLVVAHSERIVELLREIEMIYARFGRRLKNCTVLHENLMDITAAQMFKFKKFFINRPIYNISREEKIMIYTYFDICIILLRASEKLQKYGIYPLHIYLTEEARKEIPELLRRDVQFGVLVLKLQTLVGGDVSNTDSHPKLKVLKQRIEEHVRTQRIENKEVGIIIFCEIMSQMSDVVRTVKSIKNMALSVGIMENDRVYMQFLNGIYNVLVTLNLNKKKMESVKYTLAVFMGTSYFTSLCKTWFPAKNCVVIANEDEAQKLTITNKTDTPKEIPKTDKPKKIAKTDDILTKPCLDFVSAFPDFFRGCFTSKAISFSQSATNQSNNKAQQKATSGTSYSGGISSMVGNLDASKYAFDQDDYKKWMSRNIPHVLDGKNVNAIVNAADENDILTPKRRDQLSHVIELFEEFFKRKATETNSAIDFDEEFVLLVKQFAKFAVQSMLGTSTPLVAVDKKIPTAKPISLPFVHPTEKTGPISLSDTPVVPPAPRPKGGAIFKESPFPPMNGCGNIIHLTPMSSSNDTKEGVNNVSTPSTSATSHDKSGLPGGSPRAMAACLTPNGSELFDGEFDNILANMDFSTPGSGGTVTKKQNDKQDDDDVVKQHGNAEEDSIVQYRPLNYRCALSTSSSSSPEELVGQSQPRGNQTPIFNQTTKFSISRDKPRIRQINKNRIGEMFFDREAIDDSDGNTVYTDVSEHSGYESSFIDDQDYSVSNVKAKYLDALRMTPENRWKNEVSQSMDNSFTQDQTYEKNSFCVSDTSKMSDVPSDTDDQHSSSLMVLNVTPGKVLTQQEDIRDQDNVYKDAKDRYGKTPDTSIICKIPHYDNTVEGKKNGCPKVMIPAKKLLLPEYSSKTTTGKQGKLAKPAKLGMKCEPKRRPANKPLLMMSSSDDSDDNDSEENTMSKSKMKAFHRIFKKKKDGRRNQ